VQTANDSTLKRINRGHKFADTIQAVNALHQNGVKVAAHLILGLPGEERADYLTTAKRIGELPFSAVKIHNLLVLRGTKLEKMYERDEISVMNEYEYAAELDAVIRALPDNFMLMRISSEAPESQIVAPKWWMKKGQFLSAFISFFEQGGSTNENAANRFFACKTSDGSYTLYHPRYKQHFHSLAGAWEESFKKYIEPCRVRQKLEANENVSLLDVGFGMGFNAIAAAKLAEEIGLGKIYIVSLEEDKGVLDAALSLPEHPGGAIIRTLRENNRYESPFVNLDMMWGDARDSMLAIKARFDYIFLDAFSPEYNPELWTFEFIERLKESLKDEGFLASYCSAYPFIGALLKAELNVYESRAFGRKRGGIVASISGNPWLPPLSEKDYKIASCSTAGIPYHDIRFSLPREEIIANRKAMVALRRADGMPKWYNPRKPSC